MAQRNLGRFKSNGRLLLQCVCSFILAATATSLLSSQPREAAPALPFDSRVLWQCQLR